jgi:hypothetical protein
VHKNTQGTEFRGMFQKHHAGPDNSDAHDSKVTHSGGMGSQHQKEEHKDPNLHTLHETTSGGGTWSFNMVGNNALGDLAQESKNWPKQGQMSETGKPGWGNSLPKNDVEMVEASKLDWGTPSPHPKRSVDEVLVEKHKAWPPQHIDQPHRTGPYRNPPHDQPPSDGEDVVEKRWTVKPNDPGKLYNDWNDKSKGHLWHSGVPFDMPAPKSEDSPSSSDELLLEPREAPPQSEKASRELAQKMKVASLIGVDVPHSDETLVEKRAFSPPREDLIPFPNDPTKGHLYHAGKAFDIPPPEDGDDDTPSPTDELLVEKREAPPQRPKAPREFLNKLKPEDRELMASWFGYDVPHSDEKLVEKRAYQPGELIPFPNNPSKGHLWHSGVPFNMPPPKDGDDDTPSPAIEKRSHEPKNPGEGVPACCKHKHSGSSTKTQPPADEMLVERSVEEMVEDDEDVLALPGHPYLVGHAAASAVQANSHPTTLEDIHTNAAAYDQAASPTTIQLQSRSEWTDLHPTLETNNGDHDEAERAYQESLLAGGTNNPIIVLPSRESTNHKADSHKLNTIQICVIVLMSLCLFCGLVFLSCWIPKKVRARNSRRRAASAEDRQRDLEMAELTGDEEGVEREIVVAPGAGRGEPK